MSDLVPHLKDVCMFRVPAGYSLAFKDAVESGSRQPWQGLSLDEREAETQPAGLERLELYGDNIIA